MSSPGQLEAAGEPSPARAWWALVQLSFWRQARGSSLVLISLGLLALTCAIVFLNAQAGRWGMSQWTYPRGKGPTYAEHADAIALAASLPWQHTDAAAAQMAQGAFQVTLRHGTGFYVFSNWLVFTVFATFLLPLWTLSFATEALGGERSANNLLWVLTRPLGRWAIFLGKYLAALPWCLALNLGGFAALCLAAGEAGGLALRLYWPAVLAGTLAFSALFHAAGAVLRRPAIAALLYAFFLETVAGNLPGQFKRLSISFYTRCLMFDSAHAYGIHVERPDIYQPVEGTTAFIALAAVTLAALTLGAWLFTRNESLDVT